MMPKQGKMLNIATLTQELNKSTLSLTMQRIENTNATFSGTFMQSLNQSF